MRAHAVTAAAAAAGLLLAAAAAPAAASDGSAGGFVDMWRQDTDPDSFDPDDEEYQRHIITIAAIPAIFGVLTLLSCLITCCTKVCAKCCSCLRCDREGGFTKKERWVPLVVLGVLAAVAMGFSAAGISENEKFTDTLLATGGDENSTDVLSVATFLPRNIDRLRGKAAEIRSPLTRVDDLLVDTVDSVADFLEALEDDLAAGFDNLTLQMDTYSDDHATVTVSGTGSDSGTTYTCVLCPQVAVILGDAGDELDSGIGATLGEIRDMRTSFDEDLRDLVPDINSSIADLISSVDEADDSLKDANKTSDDIIEALEKYDPTRNTVTLIVFTVPIAALVLAFVGALLRSGKMFTCNLWIYFVVGFVFWLLFAVHIPIAVVLSDSCNYVTDYEVNELPVRSAEEAAANARANVTGENKEYTYQVATTCLEATNLVDTFDAREDLNFSNSITLPTLGNVTEDINVDAFGRLVDLVALIRGDVDTAFGFNSSLKIDEPRLDYIEANPGTDADNSTAFLALDNTGNAPLATAQGLVAEGIATRDALQARADEMDASLESIDEAKVEAVNRLGSVTVTADSAVDLLEPLFEFVLDSIRVATCTEAADAYNDVKELTCQKVLGHLSTIAFSLFMVALLAPFIIVLSNMNAKRWPQPQTAIIGDVPMKDMNGGGDAVVPSSSGYASQPSQSGYGTQPSAPYADPYATPAPVAPSSATY